MRRRRGERAGRARWRAWLLAALGLGGAAPARASEGPPASVSVSLPSCPAPPFERRALLELLSIELRAAGVERVDDEKGQAAAALRIEQPSCEGERVLLVLEDRATGKTVERRVDLGAVEASTRARFLALSGAELLRAGWLELLALRPSPDDPLRRPVQEREGTFLPRRPAAPGPAKAPAPERAGAFAGVVARDYLSTSGGLVGALAGARLRAGAHALRIDARLLRGEASDPLGKVRLTQATAGLAFLLTTAPGPLRFGVGPRVELGVGQGSGEAEASGVVSSSRRRAVVGAALEGLLGGSVGPLEVFGALDAGVMLVGFTALADGRKAGGLYGPFVEATVGLLLPL